LVLTTPDDSSWCTLLSLSLHVIQNSGKLVLLVLIVVNIAMSAIVTALYITALVLSAGAVGVGFAARVHLHPREWRRATGARKPASTSTT
jgi:hypothetical protein